MSFGVDEFLSFSVGEFWRLGVGKFLSWWFLQFVSCCIWELLGFREVLGSRGSVASELILPTLCICEDYLSCVILVNGFQLLEYIYNCGLDLQTEWVFLVMKLYRNCFGTIGNEKERDS